MISTHMFTSNTNRVIDTIENPYLQKKVQTTYPSYQQLATTKFAIVDMEI